ncbi:MAG: ParB/RepB/Spo0J family partition protein [Gammaproteobacteria bacterium]
MTPDTTAATAPAAPADGDLCRLPVDIIRRGKYQPRLDMHKESLQDLADSISAQGVLQPIVVRRVDGDAYEIIAGERRWRAAQLAGLHEIPAIVRDVEDRAAIAIALIENIQRENLNPMEEAKSLNRLIREFELTHEQAAEAVGRSRAAVSNLLRLLDLDDAVKAMVEHGQLEMGHARALLSLAGPAQIEAARQVIARGLSVRATEGLVKQLQQPRAHKAPPPRKDPNIRQLETDLADKLGAGVSIRPGRGGKGKLEISYNSLDELDGILEHIH